ncbi:MAG: hypothetical protein HOY76_32440 [Streptomyces sp.]|nr:hypothetical protein [Streptomyces sp.]
MSDGVAVVVRSGVVDVDVVSQERWQQASKAFPGVPPHLAACAAVFTWSAPLNSPPTGTPASLAGVWPGLPR